MRRWPFASNPGTATAGEPVRAEDGPGAIPQELLDRVKAIEIRARRLVNELFLGEYAAIFRGKGLEFDELRPYIPGDDVRSLDWKTLAKTGEPFIRRYREDRDLTVIFMVDVSGSQQAGVLPTTKADLAAEICAVLALAAIRNKDKVGLILFAGEAERYVRPQGGASHVLRVVREVLWARPRTRSTNIGAALEFLTGVQKRRATVFLISDFLTGDYTRQVTSAARRHDIIAISIREPIDEALPNAGIVHLADAETGAVIEVDTGKASVREAYAARVRAWDAERRKAFGDASIDEIPLRVGDDYVRALLRFFKQRASVAA